jgi:hypothetical protein
MNTSKRLMTAGVVTPPWEIGDIVALVEAA